VVPDRIQEGRKMVVCVGIYTGLTGYYNLTQFAESNMLPFKKVQRCKIKSLSLTAD